MKPISIRVDEKLYERIKEKVHYHGELTHLVRRYILKGLEEDEARLAGGETQHESR